MVTGDQELQWAYLLCPTFELSNSEGKPLTNGYIELYIAGTRDKYYAASDFNGTLHPFQIPLDSLGANIVLVNPGQAYDVYVYNRFGNLIMSRYNVTAVGAGSGSGNSNFTIDSSDGTVVVTTSTDPETGIKTYDLSVPTASGDASYWMGRGAATMGVNIEDTEYHDIQISSNSISNQGDDIDVLDGKFSLKEGVYFWSVTVQLDKFESFDNTRQKVYVESKYNRGVYTMDMTRDESETVTFSGITVAEHDGDTEGFKIKSDGSSPFRVTLYHVAIHKLNNKVIGGGKTYTGGDYIQITDDDVINVTGLPNVEEVEDMIEAAITATASGYVYTAGDYISIDNREISVTGLQPAGDYLTQEDLEGYATETYVDNSVSSFVTESTVTSLIQEAITGIEPGEIYVPGQYVEITDENVINVTGLQPAGEYLTQEDLEGYATETYVDNSVSSFVDGDTVSAIVTNMVTAMLPPELPLVAGDGITITETEDHIEIAANVTSIEGYATESYVTSYVDNSISDFTTNTEVYEATVTAIQAATAEIPDTEEVQFEELDITQFAQASAIPVVTGFATREEVYDAVVTGIQAATGEIPDVSDFATHAEVNDSAVTSIQLVTGLIPDVTDYTTHTEVYEATVTAIEAATATIPDTEEVQFEEINLSDYALATAIPVVTGYATHTEVHDATVTAIESVTAMIPEAQVQSDWTEDDTESPAYIQNKPDECLLVAGDGIEITESNNTIVISANVTSIDGYAKLEDVYDATVTAVQTATGLIPDVSNKKDKQTAVHLTQGDTWTVTSVNQNANGEIEVEWAPIPLDGFINEEQLIEAVSAITGIGDYGQFYSTDITGAATMSKTKGTIDVTNDGKIKLSAGQSYHITVRGRYVQGTAANSYTAVSYIEYVTNNSINFNVDKTKTDSQYFELSYDLYKLNSDTNYYVFFSGVDGLIKDLFIEIHAIGSVGAGQGGGSGTEYDAGWGIRILNNVISVNPDVIATVTGVEALIQNVTATIPQAQVQSDWTESDSADPSYIQNKPVEKQLLAGANVTITSTATSVIISSTGGTGDVTEAMLYDATVTAVQTATGLIPDVSDMATKTWVGNQGYLTSVPDTYATDTEVYTATVTAVQTATGLIPEVPDVKNVVAGENITITENATAIVISSTGGGGGGSDVTEAEVYDATVTAVQAATGAIPDVSDMATKTWVGNQGYLTSIPSSYATDSEVYDATVTAVQTATGLIPDVSDFMTEEQVTALIPDVPDVKDVVAGEGITITENATGIVISSNVQGGVTEAQVYDATVTAVQTATGAIPDTSDMATKTWVGNQGYLTSVPSTYATDTEVSEAIASSVSDFVTESEVTALIPDTEEIDFEELDITAFALASAVPTVQLNSSNQVTAIDNHPIAGGGGGGTTYTAGNGIDITNDVISVDNTVALKTDIPVVTGFVTESEVTALIPEEEEVDFEELDLTSFALASAVVQSDWSVTAVNDPAYIQNKPTEKNLVAGANVTITESNDEVTIETTEIASGLTLVAGAGITITVSGNQLIIGLA